jgi:MFS transporter, DHA1 family, inner membrane transport protein
MPFALFALAMINFAVGTQGFAFAGVLPELAAELGVSIGAAGLLVAASSITFAAGAPFAAGLVARVERRRVIVASLLALAAVNLACALAPSFAALLALRVGSGVATAFVGALATVAAAALVPPERRGRAFAIVLGGLTIAFVLGVPLGSVVGGAFGWRATFLFSALVSLFSLILVLASVPRIEPAAGPLPSIADLASNRVVLRTLALTLLAFTATFTVVAFIGPIITATVGVTGAGVGAFQALIGIGSIIGLVAGGASADRGRARLVTLVAFAVMATSLATYWPLLALPQASVPPMVLGLVILVGATALFSLIPVNLARIAASAGAAAPVALALNGSLVALGQGLGATLGGLLTDAVGPSAMGLGGSAIAGFGLLLSFGLSRDPGRLTQTDEKLRSWAA